MFNEKIIDKSNNYYTIESELGRGSFGVVYLAKDDSGHAFAVKMIGPVTDADTMLSFEREVGAADGVSHPNLLAFNGHGEHTYRGNRYFFTVIEYCPDGNYRQMLDKRGVDPGASVKDFQQILDGLVALHTRTIHRDIKPENILVSGGTLKLCDLGLSKSIDEATKSLTFKGGGTPSYMAPEVWLRGKITPATDLYAVGVMLFEAVTGRLPFSAADISGMRDQHLYQPAPRAKAINGVVPDHIDGLIRKLLEKDATKRYQRAEDVAAVLAAAPSGSAPAPISALRDRMRQQYDASESKRLEAEQAAQRQKDALEMKRYMEQQLIALFDEVVDEVNGGVQETTIVKQKNPHGMTYTHGNRSLSIGFFAEHELFFRGQEKWVLDELTKRGVAHGGAIVIREHLENRQGWNVVLSQSADNPYGQWTLVESDVSALSGRALRHPPSATDAKLLTENLVYHWQRAMHTWVLKDKALERTDVEKILGLFIS